jgi:hypothetical protein
MFSCILSADGEAFAFTHGEVLGFKSFSEAPRLT